MKWLRSLLSLCALCASIAIATAPAGAQPAPQYQTGRVAPTLGQFQALKAATLESQKSIVDGLPDAKEPKWDSRAKGWIPPIRNQGNCGSCWDFSGCAVAHVALIKAKSLAKDKPLSEQCVLDCHDSGGCNGDDNVTVLKIMKKAGLPTEADYGPYHANEGRCKSDAKTKLLRIDDWAFADGDAGYEAVGSTQKIKNAIKTFGIVGCAIAADNAFMNVRPGQIFHGTSRQINHDVALVGWDDTLLQGRTVWILRNSWGTNWCDGGYCLILEGANRVGTEPVVAFCKASEPDPDPVPPGPPSPIHNVGAFVAGLLTGLLIGACVLVFFATRRKS